MPLDYRAAVLHAVAQPLTVEPVSAEELRGNEVLVRMKAAGICHTDLEVVTGALRYPLPIVLGHEAAGVVERLGPQASGLAVGDHVVLSWNPHCGHCFYCDRDLPILCERYLAHGPAALAFDGSCRTHLADGSLVRQLMFLGAFAEYAIVADHQAIAVPPALPFDEACLIGCGVMTGVGAALNVARIGYGDTVMVIGCGAVGLSAVQGARLAGAGRIIAVDLDPAKLALAERLGATLLVDARDQDAAVVARARTGGRGADVVFEAAGSPATFRASIEAVRPGGEVVWLGKTDVAHDVSFRWGSLMGEKRIRRSSYGGARPARDFRRLAQACLDGRLELGALISQHIALDSINDGIAALQQGAAIRSVIMF